MLLCQTVRTRIFKEDRSNFLTKLQHFPCKTANFPLGTVTTPMLEEIIQRPDIHSHDNLRVTGIRQNKPCIFLLNPVFRQCTIKIRTGLHKIIIRYFQIRICFHSRGRYISKLLSVHIPLALLGIGSDTMTDKLMT